MIAYRPLASASDMQEGPYKYALQGASEPYVRATMIRASRNIESRCARKFVPFGPVTQSERAEGVATDTPGASGLPMSMMSTLQLSLAGAYGVSNNLVRDVWLSDYAKVWPELWTYSDVSVLVTPPVGGGGQRVIPSEGPQPDTGHLRLPLGTYCPVGSTIAVTYSGGYTLGIPEDLVQAAMMQATKLFILGIAPERRGTQTTAELDREIISLLVPFGGPDPMRVRRVARMA